MYTNYKFNNNKILYILLIYYYILKFNHNIINYFLILRIIKMRKAVDRLW